ncbi:TadE family type IV pilus minor pilin [Kitasatospora sp. NPDC058965]|uniref:TadE family type IV pilus minor pilin n=1 Tax=Kitasatospora sp. NPDC058965 TaxID=3346682 RepID=UPI00369D8C02
MTAETAVVLPTLVLLMAMLIWGVLTAAAQLRCIDAARVAARAAARGDGNAVDLAQAVAPPGAAVEVVASADTVRVQVAANSPGLGRLAPVLSLRVSADAVATREDTVGREAL